MQRDVFVSESRRRFEISVLQKLCKKPSTSVRKCRDFQAKEDVKKLIKTRKKLKDTVTVAV